jgi:hypothetical protein
VVGVVVAGGDRVSVGPVVCVSIVSLIFCSWRISDRGTRVRELEKGQILVFKLRASHYFSGASAATPAEDFGGVCTQTRARIQPS